MKKFKILVSLISLFGVFSFVNAVAMEKNILKSNENLNINEQNEIVPIKVDLDGIKLEENKMLGRNIYKGDVCFKIDLRGIKRQEIEKNYSGINDNIAHEVLVQENKRNFFTEIPQAEEEDDGLNSEGEYKYFDNSIEAGEEESEQNFNESFSKFLKIKENIKKIKDNNIKYFIPMLVEYLESKKHYCYSNYSSLQCDLLVNLCELLKNFEVEFNIKQPCNFINGISFDGKCVIKIRNENINFEGDEYEYYYESYLERQRVFGKFIETIDECKKANLNLNDMFAFKAMTAFFYAVIDEYLNIISLVDEYGERRSDEILEKIIRTITKKKGSSKLVISPSRYDSLEELQNLYREEVYGPLVKEYVVDNNSYKPRRYVVNVNPDLKFLKEVKKKRDELVSKGKKNGVKFNFEPKDFDKFYREVFNEFLYMPIYDKGYFALKDKNLKDEKVVNFEELFYPENIKEVGISYNGSQVFFEFNVKAAEKFYFKLLDFDSYCNKRNYFDFFKKTFCYADIIGQIALLYIYGFNLKNPFGHNFLFSKNNIREVNFLNNIPKQDNNIKEYEDNFSIFQNDFLNVNENVQGKEEDVKKDEIKSKDNVKDEFIDKKNKENK